MVFPRGYMLLRGYITPAHIYRSFAWLYTSSARLYHFAWLYNIRVVICFLPWLFSSFACLYGFPWLYAFSVVIRFFTWLNGFPRGGYMLLRDYITPAHL